MDNPLPCHSSTTYLYFYLDGRVSGHIYPAPFNRHPDLGFDFAVKRPPISVSAKKWPVKTETGGRNRPKRVAALFRNGWPDWPEISNLAAILCMKQKEGSMLVAFSPFYGKQFKVVTENLPAISTPTSVLICIHSITGVRVE